MNAYHTFHIDKRSDSISLDGTWSFCWNDGAADAPDALSYDHSASLPASAYRCLEQAGILPDPYFGTNSKKYECRMLEREQICQIWKKTESVMRS